MKILIIGGTGLLGHPLLREARSHTGIAAGSRHADIRDPEGVMAVVPDPAPHRVFPARVLLQVRRGEEVSAVADKFSVPSYATDVARMMFALAEANATGIFHTVNLGPASWSEWAQETLRLSGLQTAIVKPISLHDL